MQYIDIANYRSENYPISQTIFNEVPGIYVIHAPGMVLDVGMTERLAERIASHDRKEDWLRHANWNDINLAFLYEVNKVRRLAIESSLRLSLRPLCGVL